jgi:penicillin-binding protein 2
MRERNARVRRLLGAILLGLGILLARIAVLQVVRGPELLEESRRNMVRETPVSAPRGLILDRSGRVLARNTARFTIRLDPRQVSNPTRALEQIVRLLKIPSSRLQALIRQMVESPSEPVVIKEALDEVTLARFAEIQGDFPGIQLDVHPLREYPLGQLAAHVLGHVGEIDEETLRQRQARGYFRGEWIGKDGVELSFESLLHGYAGARVIQVDVAGQPVRLLGERASRPGNDLFLTVDARLQRRAEEALAATLRRLQAENGHGGGGALVALEAHTGRVRALVSLPGYDPNWFARGISVRQFQRLLQDPRSPLLDRAVSGAYPPGSTYKIITTSAALSEDLIHPNSTFYCSGVYMVGDMPFHCFVRSGHGHLDLVDCLAHSCDVVYYRLGTELGLGRMERYSRSFGLGALTGIDLPGEDPGNLPGPGWKEKNLQEPWFAGDNANMAIGQGFLAVTPIQMALATAAVANGGTLWRPQLVEWVRDGTSATHRVPPLVVGRVPVAPAHLEIVRRGMEGAVDRGTAAGVGSELEELAGKTGTVENSPTSDNPEGRNHTWFTSYYPASAPDLVVTVFLEKSGGYGGELAAPVAAQVVREWKAIRSEPRPAPVRPVKDWDRLPSS